MASSAATKLASQNHPDSLELAMAAVRTAALNRGQNIVLLDMRRQTCWFDYFVIVTGSSRRQLHAISEEIDRVLQNELHDKRLNIAGYDQSHWIVLDYGDVVIHLFDEPTREYYSLESLWADAGRVDLAPALGDLERGWQAGQLPGPAELPAE